MKEVFRGDERWLHRTLLKAPFPAMVHAEDGQVILLSQVWTELSGYTLQGIPTVSDWVEKASGQKWPWAKTDVERLFRLNEVLNEGEYTITTSSGEKRVWDFSAAPFGKDSKGRRLVIRMAADVTERNMAEGMLRRMQEELERQVNERTAELAQTNEILKAEIAERKRVERFKDEVISAISHELRTPLAITKEGISLLLREIPGPINDRQKRILSISTDAIDRLARMVNNLLDTSRLKEGRIVLKRNRIDLAETIRKVAASFEVKVLELRLELKLNLPPGGLPLYVYADPDKVFQVLINLVGNALKYTPKGSIEISAQSRGAEVECVVADTGIGISQENLPKLFQPFQQFSRTEGGGEKGTGLGLAIAKGLVELHHGTIRAESELGVGSRFIFTLPRYSQRSKLSVHLKDAVNQAVLRNSKMALVLVTLGGEISRSQNLSPEEPEPIVQQLADQIQASICRVEDLVVSLPGRVAIVLAEADRAGALKLKERLEGFLGEYLAGKGAVEKIWFKLGFAVYPEDGKDEEGLLSKAQRA